MCESQVSAVEPEADGAARIIIVLEGSLSGLEKDTVMATQGHM